MVLSVDYSDDWQFVDGVETLSITPKNPNATVVDSVKAVRTSTLETESPLGGEYGPAPDLRTYYVWEGTLGGYVPDQGDRITDEQSVGWIVLSTSERSDTAQRRLTCVRQV